jgi:hypothetical protein
MRSREYKESGDGWRVRAVRVGYNYAQYEVSAPPKKRMLAGDVWALENALKRAVNVMGEST